MIIAPGLYFITDSNLTLKDIFSDTLKALKAGVKTVQYREKGVSTLTFYENAVKLKELCHEYGAKFIMNDRIDVALAVKADGVHLGQDDMPLVEAQKICGDKMIIGISTHSFDQAVEAQKSGADYIGFGPVFGTQTKKNAGNARGVEELAEVLENVEIPVIAIGGVKTTNLPQLIEAGAKHAAVISEVVTAESVSSKVKEINALFSI